jgi:hypothetical protein
MMSIITTIFLIIWLFYILKSVMKKNWNDFFYGICVLLTFFLKIPLWMDIITIILLIIVHKFIEEKEKEN